jgi:hypothetical protein
MNRFSPLSVRHSGATHATRRLCCPQLHVDEVLHLTGLDWTIVRPPRLTDKPLTGTYRTAYGQNLRGGFFIWVCFN